MVHHLALHLPPVVGDVDQLPLAGPQRGVSGQRGEEAGAQDAALTVVTNLGWGTSWSHVNSPGQHTIHTVHNGKLGGARGYSL